MGPRQADAYRDAGAEAGRWRPAPAPGDARGGSAGWRDTGVGARGYGCHLRAEPEAAARALSWAWRACPCVCRAHAIYNANSFGVCVYSTLGN